MVLLVLKYQTGFIIEIFVFITSTLQMRDLEFLQ